MSNKELIKEFINKLTLKYKRNEIVNDLIKELSKLDEFDSVTNYNGITKCVYNNSNNEVLFDEKNKKIIFRDKIKASYDNTDVVVFNESIYIEDEKGFHVDTRKITEEKDEFVTGNVTYKTNSIIIEKSTLVNGVKIIENDKVKKTDRYRDDIHVFNSVSKNYTKHKGYGDKLSLLDSYSAEKKVYLLANGDTLKVDNKNGLEEYYYCDSSEIYSEDKKDENKAKFSVPITYLNFMKIIENVDNAIKIEPKGKIR